MKRLKPQFVIANFFNITGLDQVNVLDLKTIAMELQHVSNENGFCVVWSCTEFDELQAKYSDLFYFSDLCYIYLTMDGNNTIIKTTDKFKSWDKETRNTFINDEFNYDIPKKIIDKAFELIKKYQETKYSSLKSSIKKIKPCDCKDIYSTKLLQEQGICINNNRISVVPNNVILEIGHTTIKIPMSIFKTFSEWYLTEQKV